jgi:two-component system invasion response regulator UvrY
MLTRVMLADDHAVVRMGFKLLLQTTSDIEIVAEADSGEEACRLYAEVKPDVLVMDLSMPGMGGVEAVKRITAHDPRARILAIVGA